MGNGRPDPDVPLLGVDENSSSVILTDSFKTTEHLMMDAFVKTALSDFDPPALIAASSQANPTLRELTTCFDAMLSVPDGRNQFYLLNHPSIPKSQKPAIVKLIQEPKLGKLEFDVRDAQTQKYVTYDTSSVVAGRSLMLDKTLWID
jgi:hypothetical protein